MKSSTREDKNCFASWLHIWVWRFCAHQRLLCSISEVKSLMNAKVRTSKRPELCIKEIKYLCDVEGGWAIWKRLNCYENGCFLGVLCSMKNFIIKTWSKPDQNNLTRRCAKKITQFNGHHLGIENLLIFLSSFEPQEVQSGRLM